MESPEVPFPPTLGSHVGEPGAGAGTGTEGSSDGDGDSDAPADPLPFVLIHQPKCAGTTMRLAILHAANRLLGKYPKAVCIPGDGDLNKNYGIFSIEQCDAALAKNSSPKKRTLKSGRRISAAGMPCAQL